MSAGGDRHADDEVSPLRSLMAAARGAPFQPLRTLDEARQHADGVAILEGDHGGQIYAVIPVALIRCSPQTLRKLLSDLDGEAWADPSGARLFFERKPKGTAVAGGMGGGRSTGDLWVHPELAAFDARIRAVLAGEADALSSG